MPHPEKPKQPSEDAIIVQNVSKRFLIPHEKKTTLKENVIGSIRKNRGYDEFHALRNVSFSIKHGESIGIIGENGSGKSTLLKILAGVLYPDEGNVIVNGKIAPFLGVGFQAELTARENVFLMYARLAFATAVAVEPDILLLDEVLAVGDEKFQMKCREKINNFKKSGATIVLVSHSLGICDRAGLTKRRGLEAS